MLDPAVEKTIILTWLLSVLYVGYSIGAFVKKNLTKSR